MTFSAVGAHGHAYPLLPLALAAHDAGHDVTFATGEQFGPMLARLGLRPLAVGGEIRTAFVELFASLPGPRPDRSRMTQEEIQKFASEVFGRILPRRVVADLTPHLPGQDLVVFEAGNIGAGLAAHHAGIPAVCHGFGRVDDGMRRMFSGDFAMAVATELGLDLPDDLPPGLGDPYVDICPESLQGADFLARARRVPMRPVAFAEPAPLPDGVLDGDGPLIYLTMGTAFGNVQVLRDAVAAVAATGARVLVATGPTVDPAALGDLTAPDSSGRVRVEAWVPQADVLPHAALVVHHGGSGTTFGCLAAGVPQLVLPQGADQYLNATMVASAGAGEQLVPADFAAEAVTEAATRLLNGSAAAAVARVAAEIAAMPTPAEVAARLPEFT